jgi:hypothetical protein
VGGISLTPAEARKLGIKVPGTARSTRKTAPARECSDTRCVECGEIFTTMAAEDRHFAANPTHRRYESVITTERNPT